MTVGDTAGNARPLRAAIWAQDDRGVLGDGQRMLWHVPGDFGFFKEQTSGCPIVMGRASFEALGRPLPERTNIVLSRDHEFTAEGAQVRHTLADALELADQIANDTGAGTVWVTGGAQVYQQALEEVDRLVVTQLELEIPEELPGLVYAPEIDPSLWVLNEDLSDATWRPQSGDARWQVLVYDRAGN